MSRDLVPFPIFIGYDPREAVAYHVLEHSLRKHSSVPLSITPLSLNNLGECFWRHRETNQSTDFSFSRFLVPFLSGYRGWSLFIDCDMICRADIAELADLITVSNWYKSVLVVKHDYQTSAKRKFLGAVNESYPRKNWSSVMLFNNYRCRSLTPQLVNDADGPHLHRFAWTPEEQIGELPAEWNHLVGEHAPNPDAKLVHYTLGGPYFPEYDGCEHADEWWENFGEMIDAQTASLRANARTLRRFNSDLAARERAEREPTH